MSAGGSISWRRIGLRLAVWGRHMRLLRLLTYLLAVAALAAGIATYWAFTASGPVTRQDPGTVTNLLYLDVVVLLALMAVVARNIAKVWSSRRNAGAAGSRLHVRLVVLFSAIALTPTVLMALFSAVFFNIGVQAWFSDTVRTALAESDNVARAYLEEHQRIIGGDASAMAADLSREAASLSRNPQWLSQIVATQTAIRGLTEAVVFDRQGRILARSGFSFAMESSIDEIPVWVFDRARSGEAVLTTEEQDDAVRALVQLQGGFVDTFLYVGRFVDPKVIAHVERTNNAVAEYRRLEGQRDSLELFFSMVFGLVALLLLLSAIWVGLTFATRLASPIVGLIDAAERLRSGDWSVRVAESGGADEIGLLSRAFNRMTNQLASQRQELIEANRELDERRRFTETVLAGVSAGVIGLDDYGSVNLPNRSASDLLGVDLHQRLGEPLSVVVPEMAELLDQIMQRPDRLVQSEIKLLRDGRSRTLLVRAAAEWRDAEVLGYVVTFDDVTELVSAQRKAAWADVARRIAHEIKNPLTPIQLSAERLKRKYLKEIESDKETFVTCTDTIIRQVGDIGRMVDEFSSFARMPAPVMKDDDLREIVRQAVFLSRQGYPEVTFETTLPNEPLLVLCDGRQINQALTNLLKNAVEAIQGRVGEDLPAGVVKVRIDVTPDQTAVVIADNGKGLPTEERDRLTEPYVTTRAKGTGLGLAIVKKIMEDHGGDLSLTDADGGGAQISLIFPSAQAGNGSASFPLTQDSHGA